MVRFSKLNKLSSFFVLIILIKRFVYSVKWNSVYKTAQRNRCPFFVDISANRKNNKQKHEKCYFHCDYTSSCKCHNTFLKSKKTVTSFLNSTRIRKGIAKSVLSPRSEDKKNDTLYREHGNNGSFAFVLQEHLGSGQRSTNVFLQKQKREGGVDKGNQNNCSEEREENENEVEKIKSGKEADKEMVDTSKEKNIKTMGNEGEKNEKEENEKEENEKEKNEITKRTFLTDTKYYKRSKYSKAGLAQRGDKNNAKIKDIPLLDDFLLNEYGDKLFYVDSVEELQKQKKTSALKNENLSSVLLRSYFLDKHKLNTLDLMQPLQYNETGNDKCVNELDIKESLYQNCSGDSTKEKNKTNEKQLHQDREIVFDQTKQLKTENKKSFAINNIQMELKNKAVAVKKEKIGNKKIDFMNEFTVIGEIVGIHGLHGYVKVVSFTTFNSTRFQKNCYRYIFMNNYPYPLPIKIENIKESLKINFLYVKFYNINSRSDAMQLQNNLICCDKRDYPPLDNNKYLSTDLLNFDIYIFNDFSNTCIGKIEGFLSKYDYIHSKAIQEISDDLIKINLDKTLSLKKIFHIVNLSKKENENVQENNLQLKNLKSVQVLINKNNFNPHENNQNGFIPSEETYKNKSKDILDNIDGYSYKKIFKCDYCDYVFENVQEASEHENSHFQTETYAAINLENVSGNKTKLYEVTEKDADKVKHVEYFFIPIIKERTIRSVHYELKKIYLDISTIFLVDNQK